MRSIPFVFAADMFEHIRIGKKLLDEIDGDRLRENLRVGYRYGDLEMAEIAPMETLLNAHLLGVAMAAGVEPAEVVESYRVDNQSVDVPFPDRIAQPYRRWIVR